MISTFSELAYTMRRPLFGPFPDLSMAVLTNRRVMEAIQRAARELDSEHGGKKQNISLIISTFSFHFCMTVFHFA
jgi:hypothetical protein